MAKFRYLLLSAAMLAACNPQSGAIAQDNAAAAGVPAAGGDYAGLPFKVTVVADFGTPWALAFLPDGRMLLNEKDGKMWLVSATGTERAEVTGIPKVATRGQAGLHDVALHPNFAQNRQVYISYVEERAEDGLKGVVLARGTLKDGAAPALENLQVLRRPTEYFSGNGHFSGRIAFGPDKKLYFTNGERQQFTPAQDPKSSLGKVLRLNDDGTPAAGNPLAAKGFNPAVWSYGHRNLLGLAFDQDGNLWQEEHGPKGGDEVNLILPGHNYGWPNASNGDHYDGKDIPDHKPGDGYDAPKVFWNPVIAPGGLMVYSGKMFPQWKGDIFIGGMIVKALVRVDRVGTKLTKGDQWPLGQRIREAKEAPDGSIWVIEDGTNGSLGRLLHLTRKD